MNFTPDQMRKLPMITPMTLNDNQIDLLSRAAIRQEMGDRLRIAMPPASGRLPENMMMLIDQMAGREPARSRINPKTSGAL